LKRFQLFGIFFKFYTWYSYVHCTSHVRTLYVKDEIFSKNWNFQSVIFIFVLCKVVYMYVCTSMICAHTHIHTYMCIHASYTCHLRNVTYVHVCISAISAHIYYTCTHSTRILHVRLYLCLNKHSTHVIVFICDIRMCDIFEIWYRVAKIGRMP